MSIFIGFFLPIPTLFLLAPLLLGPGETTHLELLGTKRVKGGCFFQGVQLCGYAPSRKVEDFFQGGWYADMFQRENWMVSFMVVDVLSCKVDDIL